jgi:hypothetical protein
LNLARCCKGTTGSEIWINSNMTKRRSNAIRYLIEIGLKAKQ